MTKNKSGPRTSTVDCCSGAEPAIRTVLAVRAGRVVGTVQTLSSHVVTTVTVAAAVARLTRAHGLQVWLAIVERFTSTTPVLTFYQSGLLNSIVRPENGTIYEACCEKLPFNIQITNVSFQSLEVPSNTTNHVLP